MKSGFIYGLLDRRTGEIRYIGKTTMSLADRLSAHRRERGQTYKTRWVRSIGPENIDICLLAASPLSLLNDLERQFIGEYRNRGFRLTNLTNGGEVSLGPKIPKTAMHNYRNSLAQKRRHARLTPEQRSEIARKGRAKLTPEQRSEIVRKAKETMGAEGRSAAARKREAALTSEQKSERARRGVETLRRKRAVYDLCAGQTALV